MSAPLKSVFGRATFDQLFIRQRDGFSCAAASFATIARLYKLDPSKDLAFFKKALKVTFSGAQQSQIEKACGEHLPAVSEGANTYHGGIALASIRYKPDGISHAVVFLARKDDIVVYYDPLDHRIWRDQVDNMRRDGTWTANFPSIPGADFDFWVRRSEQNPFRIKEQEFWIKERRQALKAS